MAARGIRILEVEAGSTADAIGLEPGDQILRANGHEISDELALKFYLSEEHIDLRVRRSGGGERHLSLDLSDTADLGIKVEEFRTRTCNNACLFCFIDQLPPNVRPSLKVKDDDYRLSFLYGNYITLTNLNDRDLDRIIELRLSPLYLSVHATDPALRTRVLGRKKADDLDRKLVRLIRGGIRLHAQIVLMPGINDGSSLEKTVFDLYRFYPGVQSVAIVPLGLSDHGRPKDRFLPVTPDYSRETIQKANRWQSRFRAQIGRTFACLADEFYLQAGMETPPRDHYDDFAQIEDGVGMVREFLDEFDFEMGRRRPFQAALKGTLATGKLFSPLLKRCMEGFNHKFRSRLQVCEAESRFLGRNITVAGLLGGRDILTALRGKEVGDFLIIPNEAVSRGNGILVDNLSPRDLSESLGRPVYAGGRTVRDLFSLLFELEGFKDSH
jgi:putative radical SAM enzyme (TIGR03279 family)